MIESKKYAFNYWDGKRKYGYGGYKYIPGRWKKVAKNLIKKYKLNNNSKILDVGCGKGFLLYEIKKLLLLRPQQRLKPASALPTCEKNIVACKNVCKRQATDGEDHGSVLLFFVFRRRKIFHRAKNMFENEELLRVPES